MTADVWKINKEEDKVSSFIPMNIYRNPQLLKTECIQPKVGTQFVHNEYMQNIIKIILHHCYAHTMCNDILSHNEQWKCSTTQHNLNIGK